MEYVTRRARKKSNDGNMGYTSLAIFAGPINFFLSSRIYKKTPWDAIQNK